MILNYCVCSSFVKNYIKMHFYPILPLFLEININRTFINVSFWNFEDFVSLGEIWFPEKHILMRQNSWFYKQNRGAGLFWTGLYLFTDKKYYMDGRLVLVWSLGYNYREWKTRKIPVLRTGVEIHQIWNILINVN